MALKLIDPVYSQMPFFQPNQVLTYNHLNDLAGYLYQQERYTRNKLLGTGVVCGLSFSWTAVGNNAQVRVDEGCAVTSAGYLIVFKQPVKNNVAVPFTHKRVFSRLKDVDPFKDVANIANANVYELITEDEYNAETIAVKSILAHNDRVGTVLVMLFDLQALNVAKCLDESCDDKGKIYDFTPRPLLVPMNVIDAILDAASSKPYFTELGRGHKGKENILFDHNYLYVKNLFRDNNLENVDTPAELADIFKYPFDNSVLTAYQQTMDNLITKFPWIFSTQIDCMKSEVPALNNQTLGNLFVTKFKAVRDGNKNYVQYSYDFARDVMDAYNEMLTSVGDLVGECCGNELTHPFHVMLGKPQSNDSLACYKEEKYNEHTFKYRNHFVPSPIVSGQFMLYEKTLNQFKRLVRIIANFTVNAADTTIKVIPGKDYGCELGERVIPYFYANAAIDSIRRVWNYNLTKRNKLSLMKGYQLPIVQEELLNHDTSKGNFYRIEGHIGMTGSAAKTQLDALRRKYNLPFAVSTVSIQEETKSVTCNFQDLEEEYSYYRDRANGYMIEFLRWLEGVRETLAKVKNAANFLAYYDIIIESIKKMQEILKVPCLDKFDYNSYKKEYLDIWNVFFEVYYLAQSSNVKSAVQALNTSINIMNVIFFRPIYKVWYMYKYRLSVLTQGDTTSLKLIAKESPGAEHLAGVRRGETFLMVTDQVQGNMVVADFSLPDFPNGNCECQTEACDGTRKALVSPLQKPIVMVVDYETEINEVLGLSKIKAVYNEEEDTYELELDAMGFYKGGSTIAAKVKILEKDKKTEFKKLKGAWKDEKLVLSCKKGEINDGAYALFYEMKGDFDEDKVLGVLYLFVHGKMKPSTDPYTVTHGVPSTYATYYPYDQSTVTRMKMRFEDENIQKRTIGKVAFDVLEVEGNQIGIATSPTKAYMQMIETKQIGTYTVPIILEGETSSIRTEVIVNIIARAGRMENQVVTGKIVDNNGKAMKDVRIRVGEDEVITDEEGNYRIEGLKGGEILMIEKAGYKTHAIQANDQMATEINMGKQNKLNIKGMENIELPDFGSLAKGFNAEKANLNNARKK